MTRDRVRKAFLLLLVVSVSVVFLAMLRSFLVTILMAAIFSGLLYPSYEDLVARLRSRALAATVTVLCTLVLVIAPLLLVLTYSLAAFGPLILAQLAAIVVFRIVEAIVEVVTGGDPASVLRPTVAAADRGEPTDG